MYNHDQTVRLDLDRPLLSTYYFILLDLCNWKFCPKEALLDLIIYLFSPSMKLTVKLVTKYKNNFVRSYFFVSTPLATCKHYPDTADLRTVEIQEIGGEGSNSHPQQHAGDLKPSGGGFLT